MDMFYVKLDMKSSCKNKFEVVRGECFEKGLREKINYFPFVN